MVFSICYGTRRFKWDEDGKAGVCTTQPVRYVGAYTCLDASVFSVSCWVIFQLCWAYIVVMLLVYLLCLCYLYVFVLRFENVLIYATGSIVLGSF